MKYQTIAQEDWKAIMDEVTDALKKKDLWEKEDKEANTLMLGTLLTMMSDIFAYLPEEERIHILVNCATWYDIGLLAGRSPGKLTQIMDKVNPSVEEAELPNWMDNFAGNLTK